MPNNSLDKVKAAIATRDVQLIRSAMVAAIEKDGITSPTAHEIAVLVQNHKLPFDTFLEHYVANNPQLLTSAQLRVAESYAEQGRYDDATLTARELLCKLMSLESFKNDTYAEDYGALAAGACLVMTSAYTAVGARSYSSRLLQKGLGFRAPASSVHFLQGELANLRKELSDPNHLALDQRWEEFFHSGAHFDMLAELCTARKFVHLSKRIELLENNFRFQLNYQLPADEFLLEVHTAKKPDSNEVLYFLK